MGKKPIVSVTYENETISIKKQLNLLKMCVKSLLCGPHGPIYGRVMGFYVNVTANGSSQQLPQTTHSRKKQNRELKNGVKLEEHPHDDS